MSQDGLGLQGLLASSPSKTMYNPNALSPIKPDFSHATMSPTMPTPTTAEGSDSPMSQPLAQFRGESGRSEDGTGPFNFEPMVLAKSPVAKSVRFSSGTQFSPSTRFPASARIISPAGWTSTIQSPGTDHLHQNVGQRRGHKYKHSSVSHQIFLEPPPRAPLALPNSLPIPTFSECRASMTTNQKLRFWWSVCHMAVAGYAGWSSKGSAAMQALSHLIFYDSIGAMICVSVEVISNFEVWSRSSVRHPFGLQRLEVIAGFALSVLLVFTGFDLVSHNAKHALEGIGHTPHHTHGHERVSAGAVDFTAVLAIISTLVSAVGLKNHARIGKAMRFAAMENLPWVLSNPSHFLTLSCSAVILLLPLLSLPAYGWIDKALSATIAVSMCFLGVHLGKNVGSMLLMSYAGKGVKDVIRTIEAEPAVTKVEEAKFWQAHYGVGIANLKLRVRGTEESLLKLRERLTSLVRNRLDGGYGSGLGQKWEVSVQFNLDHDDAVAVAHLDHGHRHVHSHSHGDSHGHAQGHLSR